VVTVTGGSNKRVSLAALIAIKPGRHPRLIYRVHKSRRRGKDQRKGFTETGYARLLDAARAPVDRLAGGGTVARSGNRQVAR
jgi:putative transposase